MNTHKPISSRGAPDAYEPLSSAEKLEEDASLAAVAAGGGLRAIEVAAVVLIGLLVCPPLAVLAFVTVVPFLVVALILGVLAAVLSTPVLLFHHLRGRDGGHLSLLWHRLRLAAQALVELAPHRMVAAARKPDAGR
jgi:hypothetical protein